MYLTECEFATVHNHAHGESSIKTRHVVSRFFGCSLFRWAVFVFLIIVDSYYSYKLCLGVVRDSL